MPASFAQCGELAKANFGASSATSIGAKAWRSVASQRRCHVPKRRQALGRQAFVIRVAGGAQIGPMDRRCHGRSVFIFSEKWCVLSGDEVTATGAATRGLASALSAVATAVGSSNQDFCMSNLGTPQDLRAAAIAGSNDVFVSNTFSALVASMRRPRASRGRIATAKRRFSAKGRRRRSRLARRCPIHPTCAIIVSTQTCWRRSANRAPPTTRRQCPTWCSALRSAST